MRRFYETTPCPPFRAGALLLLLWMLLPRVLSAQVPPAARWQAFDTEHFRVSFQPEIEPVARRAAAQAEWAYGLLARELTDPPAGRIDLVVANNVDFANGYATPLPTNRIVIYAHPPVDEPSLAFTDDWMQLVVLHELVHIFHLDQADGIWQRLRAVFGRNPVLFPQLFSPGLVTEGLATYVESSATRAGRVRGTYHEMALRTAVLQDAFFSIDQAVSSPLSWPAASTRYIYGSLFFTHLARRHGPQRVAALLERYGGQWIPYRLDAAARRELGVSLSREWQIWSDSLHAHYARLADSLRAQGVTTPEILTREGRLAVFPRYAPDGSALAFAASDGRTEPALRLVLPDGSLRTVEERTSLGAASWLPTSQGLLFTQLDYVDPYRIFSDLYETGLEGGDEALTRAARIWEPDVHPDGRRVAVVTDAAGTNVLAIHDLGSGETRPLVEPSLDVQWSVPRWSPDGSRIAVGRWTRGGLYDVVVLDSLGHLVHEVTHDRAIDSAPAWSPDGRFVVFSSDRTGIPNLYAFEVDTGKLLQVSNVLTGAFQPDVSPDGRWIAFSYYQADGFHIARLPFDSAQWRDAPPVRAEVVVDEPMEPATVAGGRARPYSPWPSVLPAGWSLIGAGGTELGWGAGAAIAGTDVVGRHVWGADLIVFSEGLRLHGGVGYRYRGWGNPMLDVEIGQGWSVQADAGAIRDRDGRPIPSALLRRERRIGGGIAALRRRWRSNAWLEVGAEALQRDLVWNDPEAAGGIALREFPLDLGASLEMGFTSARGFAFSLGREQGVTASASVQGHRYVAPFPGEENARGYLRTTGRGLAFQPLALPGFSRHVLALRVDAGAEMGAVGGGFSVGGASGVSPLLPGASEVLGRRLAFPIRGYPVGVQQGDRAVSTSVEYRFPLLLVERGFRLVPLSLTRLWGDLFVDAGGAWCAESCAPAGGEEPGTFRPLASVGAELLTELRLGFVDALPVRLGVAFPLQQAHARKAEFYVRLGRSF